MRSWFGELKQGLFTGLWFIFGELLYKFLTGNQRPGWRDLPGYATTLAAFLLCYATVRWWRKRRRQSGR